MERVEGIEPSSPAWKAGVIAFIRYPQAIDFVVFNLLSILVYRGHLAVNTTLSQPRPYGDRAQTIIWPIVFVNLIDQGHPSIKYRGRLNSLQSISSICPHLQKSDFRKQLL